MTQKTKQILKSYFETGDIPTQGNYVNLIDSLAVLQNDHNSGSLTLSGSLYISGSSYIDGNITASGNISASGNVQGDDLRTNDELYFRSNISGGSPSVPNFTPFISSSRGESTFYIGDNEDMDAVLSMVFRTEGNGGHVFKFGDNYGDPFHFNNDLDIVGSILASGNISASGEIIAASAYITNITASGNISASGEIIAASAYITNITASGNISSSGTILSKNFTIINGGSIFAEDSSGNTNDHIIANVADLGIIFGGAIPSQYGGSTIHMDSAGFLKLDSDTGDIQFQDGGQTKVWINSTTGHITASGNISASGAIISNTLKVDGSQVDFTGLPTSDPGIVGRLYRTGADIKISI